MRFPRISRRIITGTALLVLLPLTSVVDASGQSAAPDFTADPPTVIFINELHYDNVSTDVDEKIEVAAPTGTDVTTLKIVLYNQDGEKYGSEKDLGASAGTCDDYSLYVIETPGIQNGPGDGLALVDTTTNTVIQLLSYEGTFTAVDGPAAGLTSTDIGVSETPSTPAGQSLQLAGDGAAYDDFAWQGPATATFGACNHDQSLNAQPTFIELRRFEAVVDGTTVTLIWETGLEIDNTGFHLYRAAAEEGERTRLNAILIGATAEPGQGATYTFTDEPGAGRHYYWLEDVDLAGGGTLHGPVTATVVAEARAAEQTFLPLITR